jgi:protease I
MKKIAILVETSYQDLEVWYPFLRLKEEGFDVLAVGTGSAKEYKGKHGYPIVVDKDIDDAKVQQFDAVLIPGGFAPDYLRRYPKVVEFVRAMHKAGKVVAAICHGGWLLASAEIVGGKTVTSFFAIKDDLVHAGAKFVDQEVAVDGNIITSRKPEDLPAFVKAIIKALK